jgi:hypothetical protein
MDDVGLFERQLKAAGDPVEREKLAQENLERAHRVTAGLRAWGFQVEEPPTPPTPPAPRPRSNVLAFRRREPRAATETPTPGAA